MLKIIATAAVAFATGVVAKMSYDKFQERKGEKIVVEVSGALKDGLLEAAKEAKKVAAAAIRKAKVAPAPVAKTRVQKSKAQVAKRAASAKA